MASGETTIEDQSRHGAADRPDLRVVAAIPAYNEARYIGSVVLATRQHVTEVIVMDDGSSDGTAEIARMAGATVIRNASNQGKGAVMRALLARMKERTPGVLVFLDADGQHDPNEIPLLVNAVREGYDLVVGSRERRREQDPVLPQNWPADSLLRDRRRLTGAEGTGFRERFPRLVAQNDCRR